jgi:hypothetical protein
LASPDSYLVNGQPLWDPGHGSWFSVPQVQEIVNALEQAYQRGRKEFPETIKFAQNYDADKVYEENWKPVVDKMIAKA